MKRFALLSFLATGLLGPAIGAAAPAVIIASATTPSAASSVISRFHASVQPILEKYCYDCHGDGSSKGKVAFDGFASDAALVSDQRLWLAALKNVRSGMMPPDDGPKPTVEEAELLASWVKYDAFGIDPKNPDPGRVAVRRLNRAEYRNSIRDLMGFDFNSSVEFPPDDSGDGFDNNGEVLSVSPLLLEKYLQAAEAIVSQAVPKVARVLKVAAAPGREFRTAKGSPTGERIDASDAVTVTRDFVVDRADRYRLVTELEVRGSLIFDPRKFSVVGYVDGIEQFRQDAAWHESKVLRFSSDVTLGLGSHVVGIEVVPQGPAPVPPSPAPAAVASAPPVAGLTTIPGDAKASGAATASPARKAPPPEVPRLSVRVNSVQLQGPLDPAHWVPPANYALMFGPGDAPREPAARDAHARLVLRRFATRAFRRPVEEAKVAQLAGIAREIYQQPGETFETGIARAMMAVIASPRFLFRVEPSGQIGPDGNFPLVDEYALASRLSFFLWSSMPDDMLLELAAKGELRKNFAAQVERMLRDEKSQALVANFTGQWLQARDVETVPINPSAVLGRAEARSLLPVRGEFDSALREAMRKETEACFAYLLREDRSVLELIDSDYTFLNERLAKHYSLPAVKGEAMQLVTLPAGSTRGGVLTQGTVLAITSNPTRTSPVKRGLFILDNILGASPPPPPPDIPALEDAKVASAGHEPTTRELLAEHRRNPVCSSCHQRMDPLGLAFENFTALGTWRDVEHGQPVSAAGQLATGETFSSVNELKRLLTHERRLDYYRCLAGKLLTYALGRGILPADLHTIDDIVTHLDQSQGRFSVLLGGILDSPAFQKQRPPVAATMSSLPAPSPSLVSLPGPVHP